MYPHVRGTALYLREVHLIPQHTSDIRLICRDLYVLLYLHYVSGRRRKICKAYLLRHALYTRAVCYAHGALCGDLLARPELHAHKPSHLVFSGIYHGHVQILQHTLYGNLISQRQFIRIYRLLKWQLSVMALK